MGSPTVDSDETERNMASPLLNGSQSPGGGLNFNTLVVDEVPRRRSRAKRESASSRRYNICNRIVIEPLQSIEDVPEEEKLDLAIKKLQQCCVIFDFTVALSDLRCKEIKRKALNELYDYFKNWNGPDGFPSKLYPEVKKMFLANTVRPCSSSVFDPNDGEGDEDDSEPECTHDCSWPHLSLVYDIFLQFLQSPSFDLKTGELQFNYAFILRVLALLNSEDPRERTQAKSVLHHLYAKFVKLRSHIRRQMCYILLSAIHDHIKFNGIQEILELEKCIIGGFHIPMKEEHLMLFKNVLLPLRFTTTSAATRFMISECIRNFISKDSSLAYEVIEHSFRKWRHLLSHQQINMLDDIDFVLSLIDNKSEEFLRYLPTLVKKIIMALGSSHFQVCERALQIVFRISPCLLVKANIIYLRQLYPTVFRIVNGHWRECTQIFGKQIMAKLEEINGEVCQEVRESLAIGRGIKTSKASQHEELWKTLEDFELNKEIPKRPIFSTVSMMDVRINCQAEQDLGSNHSSSHLKRPDITKDDNEADKENEAVDVTERTLREGADMDVSVNIM